MRRQSSSFPFRTICRFVLIAAAAPWIAACANAVRLSEPVYTGSTENQKQIISAKSGGPGGGTAYGPSISSHPLPPPARKVAAANTASSQNAPAPYLPPKPYAANGLPMPLGPVSQQAAAPAGDGSVIAARAPRSLNQQAADLGERRRGATGGSGYHTVQPGESLWGLSRRYGVSTDELISANDLTGTGIRSGQRLLIPGADGAPGRPVRLASADPTAVPVPAGPRPSATASGRIPVPTAAPAGPASVDLRRRQADDAPRAYAPPQSRTAAVPQPSSTAVSQTGSGFRWPVRGRVISSFGKKPNGERNDGINLAVPEGTAVKAAESGVVIYAGNELKSYGNLILIKHADGWVSAYAHNSKLLVNRGDEIRRGQIVAESGMTGGVTSPQLHFELRKGASPVNPLDHLSEA